MQLLTLKLLIWLELMSNAHFTRIIQYVLDERGAMEKFCRRLQYIAILKKNKIINWIIWVRENGVLENLRKRLTRSSLFPMALIVDVYNTYYKVDVTFQS